MNTSRNSHTNLGELIDAGLRRTNLSLRGLAEQCGVDPSTLTRLRHGEMRKPDEDMLRRIARHLGQDIEDYHVALLADRGQLPRWGKVLGTELGIRLSNDDEQAITQFVEAMLKHRRNG
ncbi:helix-turn-helix transcriptional regulator [Dactylosporangium sp. NPDC005572]|uniref:helix-turn-helix domain-containing protein n=1 Tax=Dactylosporangium sp. NPDC005572 TaxID=3156889 RepID=UPI0033A5EC06